MRSLLIKASLLLASVVFMLLSAEGLLRFYPPFRPLPRTYVGEYENRQRHFLVADPVLGWKFRPNSEFGIYHANAQGFRARSDFDPNRSCKTIALAGDSFTFGMNVGYQETFASLIETGLPGTCVDNMGIPGFGLDQMWLTVRTQALPLHPRLVTVAFIGADLARSEEAYRPMEGFNKPTFKLVDGRLVPETARDRPNFLVRFLQAHSSVWRVARLGARTLGQHYPFGEWWTLNAAILDAIRDDCRRAGVPVLFIYIPSRDWKAFPTLSAYMARNQASFIDMSEGGFALTPDMYIPANDHLNDKGHRQVADAVLRWLQQNPQFFKGF
ncbi:MAG TPA: SGNH/GDSL hydrolase family protein [Terriglobia bacterium]|nr:SGNH/GDSL hydrolase family protein [Terriglobia bacterium]